MEEEIYYHVAEDCLDFSMSILLKISLFSIISLNPELRTLTAQYFLCHIFYNIFDSNIIENRYQLQWFGVNVQVQMTTQLLE